MQKNIFADRQDITADEGKSRYLLNNVECLLLFGQVKNPC
jgi:hypothetical protein